MSRTERGLLVTTAAIFARLLNVRIIYFTGNAVMCPRSNLPFLVKDKKRSPVHIMVPVRGLREHHPSRVQYQGDRKQEHGIFVNVILTKGV